MAIPPLSVFNVQPAFRPHRHEDVRPEFVVGSSKFALEAGGAGAAAGPSRLPPLHLQHGQSSAGSLRSLSPFQGSQHDPLPQSPAPQPEPLDGAPEEDIKPSINESNLPLDVGDIEYEYPVRPPLDPNDPNWLEPMMAQLRRERRVVEDHIEDSHLIMGQVTKELFLAQAELKEEKKETDSLLKFIGQVAGPAFLQSMLRQLEQGNGELSAESEDGLDEDVADASADKGPRSASRKRPREDDEDDDDGTSEPKIREAYKRRKQELKEKLRAIPLCAPSPGVGNGPEAGPSRPTKGGKGPAVVAQFLPSPSPPGGEDQLSNASASRAAAAQQDEDDLYLNPDDADANVDGELPVARRETLGDIGDEVPRPDGLPVPHAGQHGSDDSARRTGDWDLVLWKDNGSNAHDADRSAIAGPSRHRILPNGLDSSAADAFLGDYDEVMVDHQLLLDDPEVYGRLIPDANGGAHGEGEEDEEDTEHPGADEGSDGDDDDDTGNGDGDEDSDEDDGDDDDGFGGQYAEGDQNNEDEDQNNEDEDQNNEDEDQNNEDGGQIEEDLDEDEEDQIEEDQIGEEDNEDPYLDDYGDEFSDEEHSVPHIYYLNQVPPPAALPVPLQPPNGFNLGNAPYMQNQNAALPPDDYEPEMVSRQRDHLHGNHAAGWYYIDTGMSDREHRRVVDRMMADNRAYEREYLGVGLEDDLEDSPRTAPTS